jgi:GPI mannosyltransferase 3
MPNGRLASVLRLTERIRHVLGNHPWVVAICALAAVPRAWLAVTDHSVFWPDEIYQTIEPAHRAAFGYGLYSWEFRDAARSWILPGAIAAVLKLLGFFTSSSLALVIAVKLLMVAAAITAVVLTMRYAQNLGGKTAGIVAGLLAAFFPPLLVFSHRATPEMVSGALVVGIPVALSASRPTLAGALAGLSFALRMQTAPIAAVFFGGLLLRKRLDDARLFLGAGATVIGLAGAVDWVTWGAPFDSIVNYMAFTLKGGSSTFGIEPASYFLKTLWTSTGWATVAVVAGLVAASWTARVECLAIATFVGAHALIPHKEFRFLTPVMPLALGLAGAGVADLWARARAPAWGAVLLAGACALASGFKARSLTNGDLGHNLGTPYAAERLWHFHEGASLLLARAGEQPDVCGVLALGLRAGFTGGYSYLHREVPLLYRQQACGDDKVANYIVARDGRTVPRDYRPVERRGEYALFHRSGTCTGFPKTFDFMLEGADDMGLRRAPIRQPDLAELDIPAGSSAAAFVNGWSHGEHLECRETRWALGRSARIVFPLEPSGLPYALTFTAQPYHRATPQAMSVLVNGVLLREYPMPVGWLGYQAIVPPDRLRSGQNEIELRFSNSRRAEGNDKRELAALFDRVRLAPVSSSLDIDVGTSDGRAALESGFSGDETIGKRTAVWSIGPASRVTVSLNDGALPVILRVLGLAFHPIAPVDVSVSVNDRAAGVLRIPARWTSSALVLPEGAIRTGINAIDLRYSVTGRPKDFDPNTQDDRVIAVMLDRISLDPVPRVGRIDFGVPAARAHLLKGWSNDERTAGRTVVWSDGPSSEVAFRRPSSKMGCALKVMLQVFPGALPLSVKASVNGNVAGELSPSGEWGSHEIYVAAADLNDGVNILRFDYTKTARPKEAVTGSNDSRELAVRVDAIELAAR